MTDSTMEQPKRTAAEWAKMPSPAIGRIEPRPLRSGVMGLCVWLEFKDGQRIRIIAPSAKRLRRRLRYFHQIPGDVIASLLPPGPSVQPKKPKPAPAERAPKPPKSKVADPRSTNLRSLMKRRNQS